MLSPSITIKLVFVFCLLLASSLQFVMSSIAVTASAVTALLNEALADHKAGRFDSALLKYEELLPIVNGNVASSIQSNRGAIYLNIIGDNAKAKECFQESVNANKKNVAAHFNLAVILTTKFGEHARALVHCKLAIAFDPSHHKAVHLMGNILQSLGREDEAQEYFVRATEMTNADGEAQIQQAKLQKDASTPATRKLMLPILDMSLNSSQKSIIPFSDLVGRNSDRSTEVCANGSINTKEITTTCVSTDPVIAVIEGFLSDAECDRIVEIAEPLVEPSFVMGGDGSGDYRKSDNAWLPPGALYTILPEIQQRLAIVTGLPIAYIAQKSEQLQVVRYLETGHFNVHQDSSSFHPRILTALMYLNNVDDDGGVGDDSSCPAVNGATWFPFANVAHSELAAIPAELSVEDAISIALSKRSGARRIGTSVTPKKGSVAIFFNHYSDLHINPRAVHAGLPVRGQHQAKWVANYWIGIDEELLDDLMISTR